MAQRLNRSLLSGYAALANLVPRESRQERRSPPLRATDRSDVLVGFGASAIGRFDQGYGQNEVGVRAYEKAVTSGRLATIKGHALTYGHRMRSEIIERIMCDFGADLRSIANGMARPRGRSSDRHLGSGI